MKTNTALLAVGLFTLAGVLTISCGGSSDEDNGGSTAGTTSNTSGASGTSTAGTTSNGGTSSNGGTTNNTAGTTNNTAGTTNNNNGGAAEPGAGGAAEPGAGGAAQPGAGGAGSGCPATMPADGSTCMQGDSPFQGCTYDTMNCRCRRANGGQMRTWQCQDVVGAGGAGNFGNAVCPDNAMDGDPCTGTGLCAGQQCFCNGQETNCF